MLCVLYFVPLPPEINKKKTMQKRTLRLRVLFTMLLCAACFTFVHAGNPVTKKMMAGKWSFETKIEEESEEEVKPDILVTGIFDFLENGHVSSDFRIKAVFDVDSEGHALTITLHADTKGKGLWALSNNILAMNFDEVESKITDFKVVVDGHDMSEYFSEADRSEVLKDVKLEEQMANTLKNQFGTEELTEYTGKTVKLGGVLLTRVK